MCSGGRAPERSASSAPAVEEVFADLRPIRGERRSLVLVATAHARRRAGTASGRARLSWNPTVSGLSRWRARGAARGGRASVLHLVQEPAVGTAGAHSVVEVLADLLGRSRAGGWSAHMLKFAASPTLAKSVLKVFAQRHGRTTTTPRGTPSPSAAIPTGRRAARPWPLRHATITRSPCVIRRRRHHLWWGHHERFGIRVS